MSNNPFKLEFTLKQHTPLIHFLHDQEGATIRATELKPKLDRFIIEHVFNNDFDLVKKYLVGYPSDDTSAKGTTKVKELKSRFQDDKFRALNYKVIQIEGVLRKGDEGKGTVNLMGNKISDNWLWFEWTKIELLFLDVTLKSKFEPLISDFFIINRFGKRQSKGYGQFTLENTSSNIISDTLKKYYNLCHTKKANSHLESEIIKNEIEQINSQLKSGKNKPYRKASIFLEFIEREKPLRWDKRLLKRAINMQSVFDYELGYDNTPIDLKDNSNGRYTYLNDFRDLEETIDEEYKTEYRFVRALLGLAEHYEFLVHKNKKLKYVAGVKSENNEIERFQSPITFRVFNKIIYVTPEKIPHNIFEKNFYFQLKMKNVDDKNSNNNDPVIDNLLEHVSFEKYITTPSSKEFSLERFLNKYLPIVGFKKI